MRLDELAIQHDTDKSSVWHGYTKWYDRYLSRFVRQPITLLEMGIGSHNAASLRMWRDYLGPQARVIGLDVSEEYCRQAEAEGFQVYCGRQDDPALLARVVVETSPTVMIDDAGHQGPLQIASFQALFPLLPVGGVYVIEDLHAGYWEWGGPGFVQFLHGLADGATNRGVSTWGNLGTDPASHKGSLTDAERTMAGVHFHPSIVFIEKDTKQ